MKIVFFPKPAFKQCHSIQTREEWNFFELKRLFDYIHKKLSDSFCFCLVFFVAFLSERLTARKASMHVPW